MRGLYMPIMRKAHTQHRIDPEQPVRIFPAFRSATVVQGSITVWVTALSEFGSFPLKGKSEAGCLADIASRLLSKEEVETFIRFRDEKAAHLYLAAHSMARRVLHHTRPAFGMTDPLLRTAYGKPYLPGQTDAQPLHFSLTHAWPVAAVAITEAEECGIDVEMRAAGDEWQDFGPDVLHPEDLAEILMASDPQAAFIRCWTQKEAVSKAAGLGLQWDFASFHVCPRTGSVRTRDSGEPIVVKTVHCSHLYPFLDGWLSIACRAPDGNMPPIVIQPLASGEQFQLPEINTNNHKDGLCAP